MPTEEMKIFFLNKTYTILVIWTSWQSFSYNECSLKIHQFVVDDSDDILIIVLTETRTIRGQLLISH